MTRNSFFLLLSFVVLSLSCQQEQGQDSSATILCLTSDATSISQTSAVLNGTAIIKDAKASNANAYFYYSTSSGDAKTIKASGQRVSAGNIPNSGGDFSYNLSSLLPSTTYYYVASVGIDDVEELGAVKSFATEKKTDAISVTGTAINVTVNSATLTSYANLTADMTGDVTIGIIYSTNSSPSLQNGKLLTSKDLDGNNMYQVEATDLTPDTKYYFKSFLSRSNLNYYGDVKEFSTAQVLASVSTLEAWDVAETKASVGGKVEVSSSGVVKKEAAIYYGADGSNLEALKTKGKRVGIDGISEDGTFTSNLSGLNSETKYYYVAVVLVEGVEFCGTIKNFTTANKPASVSITGEYSDLGESSVKLYGWCNQEGAEGTSVVYGIEYSNTDLTTSAISLKASEKDSENKFCCQATGLSSNTLYYYRAYVLFNGVRTYGEVKSFTTLDFSASVTTSPATDITEFSAVLNGKLTVESKDVLSKSASFIYSASATKLEDLIANGQRVNASIQSDGTFYSNITYLGYNTTYHYVAAAKIHDKDWIYGEVNTLNTNNISAELSASDISESYATLNCVMPSGAEYRDARFYFSTSSNVDEIRNASYVSIWDNGGNSFAKTAEGLDFNTKYYFVFYSRVNNVEYWSNVSSFVTLNVDASITTGESIYELSGMGLVRGAYTYNAKDNHSVKVGFFYGKQNNKEAIIQSQSVVVLQNNDYYSSFSNGESYVSFINNIDQNATYYYISFIKIDNTYIYGEINSFQSLGETVDLGLSVKWRGMNVGASHATDRGGYYAWGETSTKSDYDSKTYTGTFVSQLPLDKDAAHVNLGGNWRMPTKTEYQELIDNCTWSYVGNSSWDNPTYINSVKGFIISSNKNGYQKKAIFLPGGGYKVGTSGGNDMCQYWASTNAMNANHYADCLDASDWGIHVSDDCPYWGYLIRPVCK